jgi:hypothetical protein
MDSNRVIRADDPWLAQSAGTPNFNVSGAIKDFRHDTAGLWVELGDSQGPSPSGTPTTTNVSQGKHLPPSWTTLYELIKLDDDTFDQKLHDGTINPEMQRKDVARQNRILSRERDRRRVENLAPIWGTAKRGEQVGAITARSALQELADSDWCFSDSVSVERRIEAYLSLRT